MRVIVGAILAVSASAATLKLTWSDCGGGKTHAPITGFTPATIVTGQTTTMTGTGNLDEDVASANFDLEMKTALTTVSCKGDASKSKTCSLPLGTGSLTFEPLTFPIKKGPIPVSVTIKLSAALPGALAKTDTTVKATGPNGEELFCVEIKTAPALEVLAPMEGPQDYTDYTFEAYLKEHEKSYAALLEYRQREEIFKSNLEAVKAHNDEFHAGKHTWWATMNHLADMTPAEYGQLRSKKYSPSHHPTVELEAQENPASVDWREKGAVTAVKNQASCGSCWAFSATESVESALFLSSGKLVELAPQTYVNCVENPNHCGGTGGCEGATMELAFNLTVTKGIASEKDLPYAGRDEKCAPYTAAAKATGYVKNPVNDANGLETALTKTPVSITVAAGSWQLYGGGLFHGCSKGWFGHQDNTLDHGVQAVGYTADYWIVRNSWGPGWGEKGFIRLSRKADKQTFVDKSPGDGVACKPVPKTQTVGGECGLLFDTSYPTGVTAAANQVVV